jgi:hypothetical protein
VTLSGGITVWWASGEFVVCTVQLGCNNTGKFGRFAGGSHGSLKFESLILLAGGGLTCQVSVMRDGLPECLRLSGKQKGIERDGNLAERHIKTVVFNKADIAATRHHITFVKYLPHPHPTTLPSLHTAMDWQSLQEGLKKEAPPEDVKNNKDTAENTAVSPGIPQNLHLCDRYDHSLASMDVGHLSGVEDEVNSVINSFRKGFFKEVNNDTTRLPRQDFFSPNVSLGARRQDYMRFIERKYTKEYFDALLSKKPNISGRRGRDGFGTPSTSMSSKTPVGSDEKKTAEPLPQKDDDEVIAVDMATDIITTHNPKMLPFEGEADWVLVSSSESEDDTDMVGDWEMV